MSRLRWLGLALCLALPVRAEQPRGTVSLEGLLGGSARVPARGPLERLAERLVRLEAVPEAKRLAEPVLAQARAALSDARQRLDAGSPAAAERALAIAEAAVEVVERRLARAEAEQAVREAERGAEHSRTRRADAERQLNEAGERARDAAAATERAP